MIAITGSFGSPGGIGVIVLRQILTQAEMVGIALMIAGVALHRGEARRDEPSTSVQSR